jgi:hypothetical protein
MSVFSRLPCVRHCVAIMATSLAAAAGTAMNASAGPIVWGSAQNISGDSDVNTSGSLVYGYQFGAGLTGTTTVNGVQFQPFNVSNGVSTATLGNVTLTSTGSNPYPGVMYASSGITSGSAPYATLSGDYQSLLSSKVASYLEDTNGGARLDIQLGGLTAGTSYLVQWWSSVTDILYEPSQTVVLGSPNATLDANTTNTTGGLGQYATGTFTAAGASETITLLGVTMYAPPYDAPTINALQVRAVPEPSTYVMALAGVACGGYSMWRRRKRA